jgi:hypothetical protein
MTAQVPEERRRPPIPRVVTRGPAAKKPGEESASSAAKDVAFFSNNSQMRQLRYKNLPDYDPNESDEQIEAKLKERFLITREVTQDAFDGRIRAAVISGPGGVGKTYEVEKVLLENDPEEEQHDSYSGYSTPIGLLKMLYKHRESGIIKADDMDSIFKDEKALNYLKVACDTTSRRMITYASENTLFDEDLQPIPKRFEFEGTMLFCTNLDFDALIEKGSSLAPHLEAFITRSHYIDLMMRTKRDYLIRVFQVAERDKDADGKDIPGTGLFSQVLGARHEPPGLPDDQVNQVLDFIEKYHRNLRECSLRMALKIGSLRKGYDPERDTIDWQRKALLTCCFGVK